jgi:hydroxymethylpyrimidine/phosphomethylpyrimidine kinase
MLYSAGIIRAVASVLRECHIPAIVVDPVMVATSGARLLQEDAIEALRSDLLPLATVITPNLPETEMLADMSIGGVDQLAEAAERIGERFGVGCLAKGGHLTEVGGRKSELGPGIAMDVLCYQGEIELLEAERLAAAETHGTGCTLSAALAAYLARGEELAEAARLAKQFVFEALRNPFKAGTHTPLGIRPPSPL